MSLLERRGVFKEYDRMERLREEVKSDPLVLRAQEESRRDGTNVYVRCIELAREAAAKVTSADTPLERARA